MADEHEEIEDVERRLKEIQSRRGGRINWHVSKHTAEMAIEALDVQPKRPQRSTSRAKSRRRKRFKRLL